MGTLNSLLNLSLHSNLDMGKNGDSHLRATVGMCVLAVVRLSVNLETCPIFCQL